MARARPNDDDASVYRPVPEEAMNDERLECAIKALKACERALYEAGSEQRGSALLRQVSAAIRFATTGEAED